MKRLPKFTKQRPIRQRIMTPEPEAGEAHTWLTKYFADPFWAFTCSFVLVAAAIVAYVFIHVAWQPEPFDPGSTVTFSPDATLRPIFQMHTLERFYSKTKIGEILQRIDSRRQELSRDLLRQRRGLLLPVMDLIANGLAKETGRLGVLGLDPNKATDADFLQADLGQLIVWLDDAKTQLKVPANRAVFQSAIEGLRDQVDRESQVRQQLGQELQGLEPVLSFRWLYTEQGWWILEVAFWSFLGVLANTIIGLLMACREDRYAAEEFVIVIPKILLAPILAVICIALWTTGITESAITELNLPYFLVLSFFLGFMTEGVYSRLRDAANLLVPPTITPSQAKLEAMAAAAPYRYVNPSPPPDVAGPPKTLAELEARLTAVAKSELERGLVSQLTENR